jgi:hypothetical protein
MRFFLLFSKYLRRSFIGSESWTVDNQRLVLNWGPDEMQTKLPPKNKPPHSSDEEALHSTAVHPPMPDINVRQVFGIVNARSEGPQAFSKAKCCPRPSAQFRLNTLHWDRHHELHRLQNLQLFILMLSPNEDGLRSVHGVPTRFGYLLLPFTGS